VIALRYRGCIYVVADDDDDADWIARITRRNRALFSSSPG
jgi:hypothetical protein